MEMGVKEIEVLVVIEFIYKPKRVVVVSFIPSSSLS